MLKYLDDSSKRFKFVKLEGGSNTLDQRNTSEA